MKHRNYRWKHETEKNTGQHRNSSNFFGMFTRHGKTQKKNPVRIETVCLGIFFDVFTRLGETPKCINETQKKEVH